MAVGLLGGEFLPKSIHGSIAVTVRLILHVCYLSSTRSLTFFLEAYHGMSLIIL